MEAPMRVLYAIARWLEDLPSVAAVCFSNALSGRAGPLTSALTVTYAFGRLLNLVALIQATVVTAILLLGKFC